MPRRKRRDKALSFEIERLEEEFSDLRRSLEYIRLNLTPFRPHYDTIGELILQMVRTRNVLNDRDPDHREPHRGHMAKG